MDGSLLSQGFHAAVPPPYLNHSYTFAPPVGFLHWVSFADAYRLFWSMRSQFCYHHLPASTAIHCQFFIDSLPFLRLRFLYTCLLDLHLRFLAHTYVLHTLHFATPGSHTCTPHTVRSVHFSLVCVLRFPIHSFLVLLFVGSAHTVLDRLRSHAADCLVPTVHTVLQVHTLHVYTPPPTGYIHGLHHTYLVRFWIRYLRFPHVHRTGSRSVQFTRFCLHTHGTTGFTHYRCHTFTARFHHLFVYFTFTVSLGYYVSHTFTAPLHHIRFTTPTTTFTQVYFTHTRFTVRSVPRLGSSFRFWTGSVLRLPGFHTRFLTAHTHAHHTTVHTFTFTTGSLPHLHTCVAGHGSSPAWFTFTHVP